MEARQQRETTVSVIPNPRLRNAYGSSKEYRDSTADHIGLLSKNISFRWYSARYDYILWCQNEKQKSSNWQKRNGWLLSPGKASVIYYWTAGRQDHQRKTMFTPSIIKKSIIQSLDFLLSKMAQHHRIFIFRLKAYPIGILCLQCCYYITVKCIIQHRPGY